MQYVAPQQLNHGYTAKYDATLKGLIIDVTLNFACSDDHRTVLHVLSCLHKELVE